MSSVIFEYDTEEGSRTFRIEYRWQPAVAAGEHDPGQPEFVELVSVHATAVDLCLDNHSPAERGRLVKTHGGVPDSIISFEPNQAQSRQLGDWFRRELDRWPDVRDQLDEVCLSDARARHSVSVA